MMGSRGTNKNAQTRSCLARYQVADNPWGREGWGPQLPRHGAVPLYIYIFWGQVELVGRLFVVICLCGIYCICFEIVLCLAAVFALCLLVVFVCLRLLVVNPSVSHRFPIVFNNCVPDCVCSFLFLESTVAFGDCVLCRLA